MELVFGTVMVHKLTVKLKLTSLIHMSENTVQGPPGTGKTKTLLHFIRLASKVLGRSQIIASAASNVAVDNIVSGLLALGVSVVRLGQPVKVILLKKIQPSIPALKMF